MSASAPAVQAPPPTLSDRLRAELASAPSVRSVAVRSGVDRAVINRFRRGKRSIDLATADRLATALGLSLSAAN